MRRKPADAWARGSSGPHLRGSLQPSPRAVEVFASGVNTAGTPPCGIFSPRESRRRFGGDPATGRQGDPAGARALRKCSGIGQGAAGGRKRCEGAARSKSHGIDQKPQRQESARTGLVRVGPCLFVFRLVTRPLCRYSSFLPFPSGLRALPRRPGHGPELLPCLRRRPALDARGIDVDAVGRHGPNRTHSPDVHGGVRAAAGLILLRRPWLPCEGRRVRRVSQEDQHGKEKDTRRNCWKGRRQPGADKRRSDGTDRSGAADHGPH